MNHLQNGDINLVINQKILTVNYEDDGLSIISLLLSGYNINQTIA